MIDEIFVMKFPGLYTGGRTQGQNIQVAQKLLRTESFGTPLLLAIQNKVVEP